MSKADAELIGAARGVARDLRLGLLALSFDEDERIAWAQWGADAAVRVNRRVARAYEPETDAGIISAILDHWRPRHCFFPESIPGMGEVGRRVAVMRNIECVAGGIEFRADTVRAAARAGSKHFETRLPPIVFVAAGVPCEPDEHATSSLIENDAFAAQRQATAPRLVPHGLHHANATTVPLAEAQLILAGGNGVTDWSAFHAVASALNACVAGSRVVCDRGTLPKSRQVGSSGASVSAVCYVALGISGAPEHLAGITNCSHVIAINTDPNAPMLRRADLAVVADADTVLRSILAVLSPSILKGAA